MMTAKKFAEENAGKYIRVKSDAMTLQKYNKYLYQHNKPDWSPATLVGRIISWCSDHLYFTPSPEMTKAFGIGVLVRNQQHIKLLVPFYEGIRYFSVPYIDVEIAVLDKQEIESLIKALGL